LTELLGGGATTLAVPVNEATMPALWTWQTHWTRHWQQRWTKRQEPCRKPSALQPRGCWPKLLWCWCVPCAACCDEPPWNENCYTDRLTLEVSGAGRTVWKNASDW